MSSLIQEIAGIVTAMALVVYVAWSLHKRGY